MNIINFLCLWQFVFNWLPEELLKKKRKFSSGYKATSNLPEKYISYVDEASLL